MTSMLETRWRRSVLAGAAGLLMTTGLTALPGSAQTGDGTVTERVNVASDGTQADSPSAAPAISADGRYVAFQSLADNLVEADTAFSDVFVHDRATGMTERVSVTSDGSQAAGGNSGAASGSAAISADGTVVAFASDATNLVDGDTNRAKDIFVRDRSTGTTTRVNVTSDGTQTEELTHSFAPAISADGRHVAFQTGAANLVEGDTNGERDHGAGAGDVFVHDRETATTTRVSVASDGTQADGSSSFAAISADGRHVAFTSMASNLVPGDTNDAPDVFVHDRDTGTTTCVSVAGDGSQCLGGTFQAISADGSRVAFTSADEAGLVPGDTNGVIDVFVRDRGTGTTSRVSVTSDGTQAQDFDNLEPSISADGHHVAFRTRASLVPDDTNFLPDVFVHGPPWGSTPLPGTPPPVGVSFDGDPATTERVDQPDPTAAAVAVSRARFTDAAAEVPDEPERSVRAAWHQDGRTARHVVVSRDDQFPDSLAGASLSAEGPLLLTDSQSLTPATRQEIGRVLAPGGRVYLLGGPAAISQDVVDALVADGYETMRLSGPTRVETAIAVADEVRRLYPGVGHAALARASGAPDNPTAGWADSVTGGAWAAAARAPILVTPGESLHPEVAGWLDRTQPTQTVLLGGTAALSANVEAAVANPRRVFGAERAATASAIATQLSGAATEGQRRFVIINGYHPDGWAYGLAAAGLAADATAPLLLVNTDHVPDATANLAATCGQPQVDLLLVGNATVITPNTQTQLDTLDGQAC